MAIFCIDASEKEDFANWKKEHDSDLLDKVSEKLKDNMCSCSFKGTELCDVSGCGFELEIDIIHETIDKVIAELKAEVSE